MIFDRFERRLVRVALLSITPLLPFCFSASANAHGNEHRPPEGTSPKGQIDVASPPISTIDPSARLQAAPVVSPAIGGYWSELEEWPLVAVHAALLPNSKVLAWDATPDDSDDDPHTTDNFTTRVTLWDPATGEHVATNNDTDTDLFCAGSAHLWDGRVLFAGGDSGTAGANGPLSNTNIYDPVTNTWRRAPNMNAPRWYSSVAALGNGEMLTFGGSYYPEPAGEVFQFDQTWRPLPITNPSPDLEDYQWLQATPEGDVLTFGPGNSVSVIETEGSGVFRPGPQRDSIELRDYGSYAMFDVGKILVAGGGESTASSVVVDTNTQQTTDTGSLNVGRRQHNLTILADGSVLATGGNTDGTRFVSATGGTTVVERWDPASGRWDAMNPMFADRQYHSIAMLLTDGRVLSAGGGICGDCYEIGYEEMNAEVYSPPYLFTDDGTLADRPRLSSVPDQVNYAQTAVIGVTNADDIDRVHLIKLGSVTHSQNQEQRLVPLTFDRLAGSLSIDFPNSRYVAPPGHYLLFAVNASGVPSIGGMVRLGHPRPSVGETVRHSLAAGASESFEYELPQGGLRVSLNDATGVSVRFGQVPAGLTDTLNLDVCEPVVTNAQTVCEFPVTGNGVWYVSLQADRAVNYDFSTALLPPGATPVPVSAPPIVAAPSSSPIADATQTVTVGAWNGITSLTLCGMIVLGRANPIGILRRRRRLPK